MSFHFPCTCAGTWIWITPPCLPGRAGGAGAKSLRRILDFEFMGRVDIPPNREILFIRRHQC